MIGYVVRVVIWLLRHVGFFFHVNDQSHTILILFKGTTKVIHPTFSFTITQN